MKLYLVRHGQTHGNNSFIFQDGNAELSEKGVKQTQFLARRFEHLPINLIISSPFNRAKSTAEEIQKITNKEIIYNDSLVEVKRPSEFVGNSRKDPKLIAIKEKFEAMYAEDPNYHHSDEENFQDLIVRAQKFLDFLETRKEDNIAVVSHNVFIVVIVGLMTLDKHFHPDIFPKMYRNFELENTGLTVCQKNENGQWLLVTWNDHAHLAEVE